MRRFLAITVSLALVTAVGLWTGSVANGNIYFSEQNGDVNGDDRVDMSDAIVLMQYLFIGGRAPVPLACEPNTTIHNGDVNGSGHVDISDPVYLLNYLFLGGPEIAPACLK